MRALCLVVLSAALLWFEQRSIAQAGGAVIVGRYVFYGGSAYTVLGDDAAIATNKSAYLAGSGRAVFSNLTSYVRGINGVMIDVQDLPGVPTAADFVFNVGTNSTPDIWAVAAAPTVVDVIEGGGVGGSDRIKLTWADNAIQNTWLRVKILPTVSTGLTAESAFFFGNRIGDSGLGNGAGASAITNATDEVATRQSTNQSGPYALAPITSAFDFNRDRLVNATDSVVPRNNLGITPFITVVSP